MTDIYFYKVAFKEEIININIEKEKKLIKIPFHYSWIIMFITFLTLLISFVIRSTLLNFDPSNVITGIIFSP